MKGKRVLAVCLAGFMLSASIPFGIGANEVFSDGFLLEPLQEDFLGDQEELYEGQVEMEETFVGDLEQEAAFSDGKEAFLGESLGEDQAVGTTPEPTPSLAPTVTTAPAGEVAVITVDDEGEESILLSSSSISDAILQARAKELTDIDLRLFGNVTIDTPIVIDDNLIVTLDCAVDACLKRGESCTEAALFTVTGGSDLNLSGGYVGETAHQLSIDGGGLPSSGPLFEIGEGGHLTLLDDVVVNNSITSCPASVIRLSRKAQSLALMGTRIIGNHTSYEGGAAIYVEDGFGGEITIGGDGAMVLITGNTDGTGEESNLLLVRAGEGQGIVTLLGDLPEGSKIGIKAGNAAHNVRILKIEQDGEFEQTPGESLGKISQDGLEGYTLSDGENLEGYLTDGVNPILTPTDIPEPTLTPEATPMITPALTGEPTPTSTIEIDAMEEPTGTPVPGLTGEPTATPVPGLTGEPTATPEPVATATSTPTPKATPTKAPSPGGGGGYAPILLEIDVPNPIIELEAKEYVYDGKAKEPKVVVKYGQITIDPIEYTVVYENNIEPGTATVRIIDSVGKKYRVNGSTTFVITAPTPEAEEAPEVEPWETEESFPTPTPGPKPSATYAPTSTPTLTPTSIPEDLLFLEKPKRPSGKNLASGVKLSWEEVVDARNYDVFREDAQRIREDGTIEWGPVTFLGSTQDTVFVDKTAKHLGTYRYGVMAATYWDGLFTHQSKGVSAPRVMVYLETPQKGEASVSKKKVTLKVVSSSGVEGYEAYWKGKKTSQKEGWKTFTGEEVTTGKLKKGTWIFKYRSFVKRNGQTFFSGYSKGVKVKVK